MAAGGINKVILIGNLGADPDLRYTPGGQAVCDLRMATNESWTDKAGTKQERTEWHRVIFWGKPAEIIKQYCQKGRRLYVEGRLQTRQWDDKTGNKRYTTEIVGTDFMFLDGNDKAAGAGAGSSRGGERAAPMGGADSFGGDFPGMGGGNGGGRDDYAQSSPDDDIPF